MLTSLALASLLAPSPLPQEVLELRHVPVETMLAHPKDEGLRRVLELLPGWIETMAEREGEAIPAGLAGMAMDLLMADMRLAVGRLEGGSGELPLRASLELGAPDPATARARAEFMMQLLELAGMPVGPERPSGLRPLELGLGTFLGLGSIEDHLVLGFGSETPSPRAELPNDLPPGVPAHMSMHLDALGLGELLTELAARDGQEIQLGAAELALVGLRDLSMAIGSDGERGWLASRTRGYGRDLREGGALPTEGITPEVLARFPADCTVAMAWRMEWDAVLRLALEPLEEVLEAQGVPYEDPFQAFAAETGFDLEADLLAAFGPTVGAFLSESTGGSSLTSGVLMLEVREREVLEDLMAQLAGLVTLLASDEAEPRMKEFTRGGLTYTSLVVPGLPIPVEPTWAVHEGVLYLGLSPQAALAAIEEARSGSAGLASNPRFVEAAQALEADDRSVSMTFVDSPVLLADGHPWMSLGMAAIANALRTTEDGEDLGMLMPTFPELRRGAKAMLQVSRVEGDDLVTLGTMDASWTVNATALLGALDQSGMMLLLTLAAATASSESSSELEWVIEEEWDSEEWDSEEWDAGETDSEPKDAGGGSAGDERKGEGQLDQR
jgi:hypothetical protein